MFLVIFTNFMFSYLFIMPEPVHPPWPSPFVCDEGLPRVPREWSEAGGLLLKALITGPAETEREPRAASSGIPPPQA